MPALLRRRRGAPKVEYPLLLGGIAVVALAAIALTGGRISGLFEDAALDGVAGQTPGGGPPAPGPGPVPVPPPAPSGTPFLVVSGPDTLSYGPSGDGGRDLYALYRVTNTGDGPVAGPITAVSDTATILYGVPLGDSVASLFLDAFRCAGGLAPGQSCLLALSSNVGAGNAVGFSGEAVSFSLAQANGPSFSVSVSLSGLGGALAAWDGDNFTNLGVPYVSFLPDRTSIYTLTLNYSDAALSPRTFGALVLDGLETTFTVLSDGCSGQTLTPPAPLTGASCAVTYVLNDAVPAGTPIFGAIRLPGSGASDVLFDAVAP